MAVPPNLDATIDMQQQKNWPQYQSVCRFQSWVHNVAADVIG